MTHSIHEELRRKADWGSFNPAPYTVTPGGAPQAPTSPSTAMDNRFGDLDAAYQRLQQARQSGDDMAIRAALEDLKKAQALNQQHEV